MIGYITIENQNERNLLEKIDNYFELEKNKSMENDLNNLLSLDNGLEK